MVVLVSGGQNNSNGHAAADGDGYGGDDHTSELRLLQQNITDPGA